MTLLQQSTVSSRNSIRRPCHLNQNTFCWVGPYAPSMSYGAWSPCLAFLYLLFLGSDENYKPNLLSQPYIHMCVHIFLSHTILWSSGTFLSPSVYTVTYLQHQGCWMSAGLLGSKKDVVFSDQLHSTVRKTELISKWRITNYFNYYNYFLVKKFMKI